MGTTYQQNIERCQTALQTKYDPGRRCRARPYFEAERKLVEERAFEPALVQAAEFADHLNQTGRTAHLIGSGCSSVATYLLGLSEVDPIRYRTHISRFWLTRDGQPPVFQFVYAPMDGDGQDLGTPDGVTAHPMTALEQVPALLESTLPPVDISWPDQTTFDAINSGDTESVFQLDAEPVRDLIARVRPTRIKHLAVVTALNVIGCDHPEVVEAFVSQTETPVRERERRFSEAASQLEIPAHPLSGNNPDAAAKRNRAVMGPGRPVPANGSEGVHERRASPLDISHRGNHRSQHQRSGRSPVAP